MSSSVLGNRTGEHGFAAESSPFKLPILLATALVLVLAALAFRSLKLDDQEPPELKSPIPFIGHILGMIKHQSTYIPNLVKHKMQIASLPMLNGKMYAIWDANLIQSAYRNKNLSFEPFVVEFAQRELNYGPEVDKIVKETGLMPEFFDAVHEGMSVAHVHRMTVSALRYVSTRLDEVAEKDEFVVDNLYHWARDVMTMATCEALYGQGNPMRAKPSLLDDVWIFESDLTVLLLNTLPSIIAPKGYQARARLQAALGEYYAAYGDSHESASGMVKARTNVLRKFGVLGSQVGEVELSLLHVSTSNTIPTLFWLLAYVFTRPELVERLREEVVHVAQPGPDNKFTIDVAVLTDKCPLLFSCYRETMRLSNKTIGNRRVMADTTISDGKGRSYLLKKDINIQMPSAPVHMATDVWGGDAAEFDADRFMDHAKDLTNQAVKAKRASFVPFGGGRHLCPGRNFALNENLGLLVSLVLGFDVSPVDGDWKAFKDPTMDRCAVVASASKPVDDGAGFGARFKKRAGWEKARWVFVSASAS